MNQLLQMTITPQTTTQMGPTTTKTIGNFLEWFHTYRDWVKSIKEHVKGKGIQVHFKGSNTIKTLLMAPKDKDTKLQKSRVIYKYKCLQVNFPEEYISETGRAFGDRLKEHLRAPSTIHHHTSSIGHPISPDCFSIVHRDAQGTTRNIKEAMYIRANGLL